ncbi:MAG: hypothetical protein KBA26_08175 [Candidatus Delongbacteria bacterium]|nr:hypothetical protein [Candidatus Delongbacteria bacterium]
MEKFELHFNTYLPLVLLFVVLGFGAFIRFESITGQISPSFIDPQSTLDKRKYYREWLRNPNFNYTLQKDLEILHQYIETKKGELFHQDEFGEVYYLSEVEPTYNWIEEGSFENCKGGFPAEIWELKSGKVSISDLSANGSLSICLEPEQKNTITRLIRLLTIPADHVKPDSRVTVYMDVKADAGVTFSFCLLAHDGHTWKKMNPPGDVLYDGQGHWQMLTGDFIYTSDIKLLKLELQAAHKGNSRAFVDNFSIMNIDKLEETLNTPRLIVQ